MLLVSDSNLSSQVIADRHPLPTNGQQFNPTQRCTMKVIQHADAAAALMLNGFFSFFFPEFQPFFGRVFSGNLSKHGQTKQIETKNMTLEFGVF